MADQTGTEAHREPEGPADLIETEYQIGQDNITPKLGPFGLDIHNPVFVISGLTIVAFVFLTLAFQDSVGPVFGDLRKWLTSTFAWFFLLSGNVFVLVCLFLIVSPYGSVRLGGREATPDYSYSGWFAMLFAAGMGIGLMFYGVSEPISMRMSAEPMTLNIKFSSACCRASFSFSRPASIAKPMGECGVVSSFNRPR